MDTKIWYFVTKGTAFLSVSYISDSTFSFKLCGLPLSIKRFLQFEILLSSNFSLEEFVSAREGCRLFKFNVSQHQELLFR